MHLRFVDSDGYIDKGGGGVHVSFSDLENTWAVRRSAGLFIANAQSVHCPQSVNDAACVYMVSCHGRDHNIQFALPHRDAC